MPRRSLTSSSSQESGVRKAVPLLSPKVAPSLGSQKGRLPAWTQLRPRCPPCGALALADSVLTDARHRPAQWHPGALCGAPVVSLGDKSASQVNSRHCGQPCRGPLGRKGCTGLVSFFLQLFFEAGFPSPCQRQRSGWGRIQGKRLVKELGLHFKSLLTPSVATFLAASLSLLCK